MNKKLGLRMAQGGLIQGDERAALYAKYGIKPGGSTPTPQPPAPTPQAPAPVQKAQSGGLLDQARSALGGRRKQLEETMNYAEGGIVRGKGGPTDDEVPMQVAGKNVNLSNTEAVLPAKTVQALGGPKAVEQLIELTNGKPPVRGGLREGGAYYGGVVDDFGDLQSKTPRNTGINTVAKDVIRANQTAAMNAPATPAEINHAPRSTTPVQDGVRMPGANPKPATPNTRPNFEYVSRAVVPAQSVDFRDLGTSRSTPVQDGVRMGTPNPTPRPNFEHVSRAVAPYNPQEIPSGTPRNAVFQDGVRIGGAQSQTGRPNWTDPTRQVAPVHDASTFGSRGGNFGQAANVIDSTAQRVPNGSDRALVPTNGQTQFHDKISAEEVARGNQNRAAAFRAADEAKAGARVEQPSRNPAPAATPPTEQTKWGKVKSGAMTVGRGLNAVGAVASGAADIATANEPAEQVAGALKMSAALPGWAGLPGKIALYGDEAVKGVTGKGVAQWLDKAAQAHPDYMLDKNREWGSAGTRADTTGPVGQAGGQTAPAAEGEGVKDFDTNLMNTLTAASRQNGGQVSFNSAKDATEYSPAAGTGVITRAPGKDGLRSATFVGGPSAGDAARDKQFAEAGYGKDSYGNWMTPGRIADQQKAAAIDARDAKIQAARDARDAENYKAMRQGNGSAMGDERMGLLRKVMTPHAGAQNGQLTAAQMNAARAIMGDAHSEQLKAQELAISGQNKQQELGLRAQESASLDAYRKGSLAQDAQKTAASARTAAQSNYLAASKEQRDMVKSYIEEMTPTAGLKDEKLEKQLQRRALMHEAFWKAGAGQLSLDPVELQGQLPMYTDVARGTVNKREAIMNPSLRDQLRNLFDGNKSREYTMNPTNTVTTEDGRVIYMPGGPGISADAVYQGNADLRDAQERINRQKAAQQ